MWEKEDSGAEESVQLIEIDAEKPRVVTAKYPGHVWTVDLTVVPTKAGFWIPWFPYAWAQVWPFCWWIGAVMDHYSRLVIGFAVFPKKPSSVEFRAFLGKAIRCVGRSPKHLISDKDKIFFCPGFERW
jgi:hypothetical protein